jgi:nitroimidazol reductase NimA-like FMN-containing flavoprotein (pyridoxamine 5'-phosphate oxidase superfamily)
VDVEVLDEEECKRLLQSQDLGRIAIVIDGRPQIFPVNYVFDEGVVVFRTTAGLKLEHGPLSAVAFETDHVDHEKGLAWSVMIQGTAQTITGAIDSLSERLRRLPVVPAVPGDRRDWMGVYAHEVTGRRFWLPKG